MKAARATLGDSAIDELLDGIEIEALGACPACLFDAAWTIYDGGTRRQVAGAVTTASNWTYPEMEETLRAALRRLRTRGLDSAEDALVDLDKRHWRSRLVRRIVERLASAMADEMAESSAAEGVRWRRLSLVPDDP